MTQTENCTIKKDNGTTINVTIEPVLTQAVNGNLNFTGVYTLYEGGNEVVSTLLDLQEIAPETGESMPLVEDNNNPVFLGRLTYNDDISSLKYTGGLLSVKEQEQIIKFIQSSKSW